ncbi:MAG: hypothetical protein HYZ81_20210 [Nitrospinae bacterium]|nr:hypothetical protein [Nitrospinota bacterium]
MTTLIRRLFEEILLEIERQPDFRRRLGALLMEAATAPVEMHEQKAPRRNRRAPGLLDPFAAFTEGEGILRQRLSALDIDQLKDIVSEHAMDSARLALKWRTHGRLVDLIVSTVKARLEKGDAFRR